MRELLGATMAVAAMILLVMSCLLFSIQGQEEKNKRKIGECIADPRGYVYKIIRRHKYGCALEGGILHVSYYEINCDVWPLADCEGIE